MSKCFKRVDSKLPFPPIIQKRSILRSYKLKPTVKICFFKHYPFATWREFSNRNTILFVEILYLKQLSGYIVAMKNINVFLQMGEYHFQSQVF